jgi:hypothetical protein
LGEELILPDLRVLVQFTSFETKKERKMKEFSLFPEAKIQAEEQGS